MTDQTRIKWPTCDEDGCIGVRLAATPKCLTHASDEQRDATLKQLGQSGEIDACGVPITRELLEQILAAAPHDAEDHPTFMAADFDRATFQGDARFVGATFQGDAGFHEATFQGDASFSRVTFEGDADFYGAIFQGDAGFGGATFERARQVGSLMAYRGLDLDDAQFAQPVQIEASTIGVCCCRARFAGGVQLRLRWARVLLDDADLGAPSLVVGNPPLSSDRLAEREKRIAKAWQQLLGGAVSQQPRLLSLQGANVAGLGLCGVDLADCRFGGAHNLDKLRVEADVSFAIAPVRLGWDWRQVIAEERAWRAAHRSGQWTKPLWPAWANDDRPRWPQSRGRRQGTLGR
jgi:uncharacterized protein YjbI with pentapeptide repeats